MNIVDLMTFRIVICIGKIVLFFLHVMIVIVKEDLVYIIMVVCLERRMMFVSNLTNDAHWKWFQ